LHESCVDFFSGRQSDIHVIKDKQNVPYEQSQWGTWVVTKIKEHKEVTIEERDNKLGEFRKIENIIKDENIISVIDVISANQR